MIEWEKFVADRDLIDSLRMDCSTLTPTLESQFHLAAQSIRKALIEIYEPFISDLAIEETKTTVENTLVLGTPSFRTMWTEWDSTTRGTEIEPKGWVMATLLTEGQIIILRGDPDVVWATLAKDYQQELIEQEGNEDMAKERIKESFFGYLSH